MSMVANVNVLSIIPIAISLNELHKLRIALRGTHLRRNTVLLSIALIYLSYE